MTTHPIDILKDELHERERMIGILNARHADVFAKAREARNEVHTQEQEAEGLREAISVLEGTMKREVVGLPDGEMVTISVRPIEDKNLSPEAKARRAS